MTIAFQTVRYLTRDMSIVSRPSATVINEARFIRQQSNRLTQALNTLFVRLPEAGPIPDQATRRWINRQCVPEILDIKRTVESASGDLENLYTQLVYAAGIARDLAEQADNPAQRKVLANRLAAELTDINTWLTAHKLALYLNEERVLPVFGNAP